jgi:hypothetical protein
MRFGADVLARVALTTHLPVAHTDGFGAATWRSDDFTLYQR